MIIRCPHCEFSRSVGEHSIPNSAEFVTCPKCKHRFRFRTVDKAEEFSVTQQTTKESVVTVAEAKTDIWDAVSSLNQKWERQIEENVVDTSIPTSELLDKDTSSVNKITNNTPNASDQNTALVEKEEVLLKSNLSHLAKKTSSLVLENLPLFSSTKKCDSSLSELSQKSSASSSNKEKLFNEEKIASNTDPEKKIFEDISCEGTEKSLTQDKTDKKKIANETSGEEKKDFTPTHVDNTDVFRPTFLYNDGLSPEERVRQQVLSLKEEQERPIKDLGHLEDTPIESLTVSSFRDLEGNIFWESPSEYGWGKSFIHTIKSAMLSAPSFFPTVPKGPGLSLPFIFFLIHCYLTILCSILWMYATRTIFGLPLISENLSNLPFMLLLAPVALGLILTLSAGIMRLTLELFSQRYVPFPLICRIICYSTAPLILSIVPFIGPAVGVLCFFITLAIAGKVVFSLPWYSAIFFTLPVALILTLGVFIFFL